MSKITDMLSNDSSNILRKEHRPLKNMTDLELWSKGWKRVCFKCENCREHTCKHCDDLNYSIVPIYKVSYND